MGALALRGLAARKLRTVAHRLRGGPRRRADLGHLHPHRHDQQVLRPDLRHRPPRASTSRVTPKETSSGQDGGSAAATLPASRAGSRSRRVGGREAGRRRRLRRRGDLRQATASDVAAGGRAGLRHRRRARAVRPVPTTSRAARPQAPDEVALDKRTARQGRLSSSATASAWPGTGPEQALPRSSASRGTATLDSLAGASVAVMTLAAGPARARQGRDVRRDRRPGGAGHDARGA